MKQPPTIVVQLIHIEGPLKGEIQDYPMPEITIGRHPSCDVRFPKELAVVSRQHARIIREGNRFKLVDQSSNGTFLNGKPVKEAFLKDGDVLMFSDGGPKVSFLTQAVQAPKMPVVDPMPVPPRAPEVQAQPVRSESPAPVFREPVAQDAYVPLSVSSDPVPQAPVSSFGGDVSRQIPVQRVRKPLIIQYGPTLRSYNELPVTIGQGASCDFILSHASIFERHAQVFFFEEQYWIKDMSGKNPIFINGRPVDRQAVLEPDCRLSLSDRGPEFRFLGGGRLAEIEPVEVEAPEPMPDRKMPGPSKSSSPVPGIKEIGSMMKRFLKK